MGSPTRRKRRAEYPPAAETGVTARHPSMLGTSHLDDLWVTTSTLERTRQWLAVSRFGGSANREYANGRIADVQ